MLSRRAIAKADLVDIESRLAPFFPQQLASVGARTAETPISEDSARTWVPPLR
jgi:hypothetical protein